MKSWQDLIPALTVAVSLGGSYSLTSYKASKAEVLAVETSEIKGDVKALKATQDLMLTLLLEIQRKLK